MTTSKVMLADIYPVACHTDHVGPGSTFVAIQGMKLNGVQYISAALERGAKRIVVDRTAIISEQLEQEIEQAGAQLQRVENTRQALARLSAQALGYPAQKLKIIGITGTKGKTSSSFLLEHILASAGKKTALLSTANNKIGTAVLEAPLTTPQPDYLHMFFAECVRRGVEYVVMEVAAQALSLHRTEGIQFDAALFTNLSLEHTEFYPSMPEYFAAKAQLFELVKKGAPRVANADDEWCAQLLKKYPGGCSAFSMHKDTPADVHITVLSEPREQLRCSVVANGASFELQCNNLMGAFNASNLAGVVAIARQLNISIEAIQAGMRTFTGVPGRMNRYDLASGAICFIDYAHNPSSYQAVLSLLRAITDHLIVVCGAGGERGHERRPLMGALLGQYADLVVLTSDNPRSEDPLEIMEHLAAGMGAKNQHKIIKEVDRKRAIEKAYEHATPQSVMVVLGKGPDEYQQIGNVKYYFSDKEVVQSLR